MGSTTSQVPAGSTRRCCRTPGSGADQIGCSPRRLSAALHVGCPTQDPAAQQRLGHPACKPRRPRSGFAPVQTPGDLQRDSPRSPAPPRDSEVANRQKATLRQHGRSRGARLPLTPSPPAAPTHPSSACRLRSKPGTARLSGSPSPPLSLPTAHSREVQRRGERRQAGPVTRLTARPGSAQPGPARLGPPAPSRSPRTAGGRRGRAAPPSPPPAGPQQVTGLGCRRAPRRLAAREAF